MKKLVSITIIIVCSCLFLNCSKDDGNGGGTSTNEPLSNQELAVRDLTRSMNLVDTAVAHYFTGPSMKLSRYYNPYTKLASGEVGSVWMYTSSIEAVNSILESLTEMKTQIPDVYQTNYTKYVSLLKKLYDNIEYYAGTYTLTSFTQTREWTVYGVNRSNEPGKATVTGFENVYDDQQWLIHELLRSYKVTNSESYLAKAEYLTDYVLDGWDCTLDTNGNENGGIPWGPGYVTKHSCSNGPMVSPLVWLYEIYRGKNDVITYRKIDLQKKRYSVTEKKADYYLNFAKKIYDWQKSHLIMTSGVYYDMMGGVSNGQPQYETVDGQTYRKNTPLTTPTGTAYSYNSGTMLSGGTDLYRVTNLPVYMDDILKLTTASFNTFASKDANVQGYYSYSIDGFNDWFNDVLMRGYLSVYDQNKASATALESFQNNLDYAFTNHLYNGMLPTNLLVGWSRTKANNNVESLFTFAFASEYAMLSHYVRQKTDN